MEQLVVPIADELGSIRRDLSDAAGERAARRHQASPPQDPRFSLRNVREIVFGSEHELQLRQLDGSAVTPAGKEQKEAKRQLLIGSATVAVNVLAAFTSPALYLVGVVGLIYQLKFLFSQAHQTLTTERRLGIYGLNLIMLVGAVVSGSILALTLGVFSGSFLRWILAKKEGQAQQSLASLFTQQPRRVFMRVGDSEVEVPFAQLRVGDTVAVAAGQSIPVDGVVESGSALVDQRMLTGESRPVDKGPGDHVLASAVVIQGRLYIRMERSGPDTVTAQAARALADISEYQRELASHAEQQQDRMAVPILALAAVTVPLWGVDSALAVLWSIPGYRMIYLSPLTMLSFMHAAARKGILVKDGRALERLRAVDTVVFDKTGTLTLDQPEVGRVFRFAELSESEILALASSAEQGQSHPIATAIRRAAKVKTYPSSGGPEPLPLPTGQNAEVTFGFGVEVTISGERVRLGSHRMIAESTGSMPPEATKAQHLADQLGNSLSFLAKGEVVVGAIELCPTIRPGAALLIAELRRRGKQVMVVSGDDEVPTRRLATELGISRSFAQVLPEAKAQIIEHLQQEGRVVCYIGDGINDSIALSRADVSVSLKGATPVATSLSQVVLMRGDLEQVIALFDLAERIEHYMRVNRLSSSLPAFIILGGTLALGWSFLTAVLLSQLTLPVAIYNLLQSATELQEEASPGQAAGWSPDKEVSGRGGDEKIPKVLAGLRS